MFKSPLRASLLALLLLTTCAAALVSYTAEVVRVYATEHRGVSLGAPPRFGLPGAGLAASPYGVNLRLNAVEESDAPHAMDAARAGGYGWVRQEFAWSAIEPAPGAYQWAAWDRIVDLANDRGLQLIAVVDTSPAWARANEVVTSPPDDPAVYARFAGQLAARYRGRLAAIQVWDEPNIAPHWGPRYASAAEYVQLLKSAALAIRAASPEVMVLAGGLAPTTEQSERNQSDVAYLDAMYRAGARGSFDALAAKPYGFWTGPEDRRVDTGVLDFSRVILLRETMERQGDGDRAVWAVEMGWNALPAGWSGPPSPWGSDSEAKQTDRTARALARARSEWPWMPVLVLPALDYPAAAPDDPVRGFALLGDGMAPRGMFGVIASGAVERALRPVTAMRQELGQFIAAMVVLLSLVALVLWLLAARLLRLPWSEWATAFLDLPEWMQGAAFVLVFGVFCLSPWGALTLASLPFLLVLAILRLDLAVAAAVFLIPFAAQSRRLLGSLEFSPLEVSTAAAAAGWAVREVWLRLVESRAGGVAPASRPADPYSLPAIWRQLRPRGPDLAVLLFVVLGLLSLTAAADPRLASRELRVVVLEPALLYLLVTRGLRRPGGTPLRVGWPAEIVIRRLVVALLAGAAAAAGLGLAQYLFTSQVITAEGGLRRMLGPYPSPNGLGLILERALPLAFAPALGVAGAVWQRSGSRRRDAAAWLGLTLLLGAATLLTFSVGAWAAAAAGCALVVIRQPRRTALILTAAALVLALLSLPLLTTERVASHFNLQSATTSAVRVSVWQSAIEMIADHPVRGVGLDGFLDLYRSVYIRPEAWREPDLSHPHNLILESWLSLGILGPLAYAWLIGSAGVLAGRARRAAGDPWARTVSLGLAAGLAAGVTHGLVDRFLAGAPDLSAHLFLTLGLLVLLVDQAPSGAAKRPGSEG